MIKPAYLVTDMDLQSNFDDGTGENIDYATEAKALRAAKIKLSQTAEDEVWVWQLAYVISKPELEPVIDKVQPKQR